MVLPATQKFAKPISIATSLMTRIEQLFPVFERTLHLLFTLPKNSLPDLSLFVRPTPTEIGLIQRPLDIHSWDCEQLKLCSLIIQTQVHGGGGERSLELRSSRNKPFKVKFLHSPATRVRF